MRGHVGGMQMGVLCLPWMNDHRAAVVYVGPMLTPAALEWASQQAAPEARFQSYVYVLSDRNRDVLYVGKAMRPWVRIPNHKRRGWWPDVATVTLFQVAHDESQEFADRAALALEKEFIQNSEPEYNIALAVL